jgi:DNA-binding transcriptional ArsR family regulator
MVEATTTVFGALSHQLRVRIIDRLGVVDTATPNEFADHFGLSQQNISKHYGQYPPIGLTQIGTLWRGAMDTVYGDWAVLINNSLTYPWNPDYGRPYRGWHNWNGDTKYPVSYVYSSSTPSAGTFVCKNGGGMASTSCGTVDSITNALYYAGFVGPEVKLVDMTTCFGDSGGSVEVPETTAVGIVSGTDPHLGYNCNVGTHPATYVTPISNITSWAAANSYTFSVLTGP